MSTGLLISKFATIEWHERETKWKVRNVNKTSLCYINKTLLHPRLRTFQCHKQTINKYMNIVKWFTTKDSLMTSVRTGVGEKSNISIQKIVPCSSPLFIFPLFPKYTCLPAVVPLTPCRDGEGGSYEFRTVSYRSIGNLRHFLVVQIFHPRHISSSNSPVLFSYSWFKRFFPHFNRIKKIHNYENNNHWYLDGIPTGSHNLIWHKFWSTKLLLH